MLIMKIFLNFESHGVFINYNISAIGLIVFNLLQRVEYRTVQDFLKKM